MTQRRSPGWWYPWIFVAGMALVVAANAVLIGLAVGTWTGLETESAYEKGLAYNQALAAGRRQQALGWRAEVGFVPDGDRRGALSVTVSDGDGRGLEGLEVEALAFRPTHAGQDVRLTLDDRGGGAYGGRLVLPLAGQWEVRIYAARGADRIQTSRRIRVP